MVLEGREEVEKHIAAFRLALVTHDPSATARIYATPRADEPKERIAVEPDEIMLGDTQGEWEFKYDPEEAKRVLAEVLGQKTGTLTAAAAGLKPMDDEGWV